MSATPPAEELVLSFLAESLADFVPGEVLAGKLGLARETVFHGVERLRQQGYRIDSSSRGYRLLAVPDRLTRLELAPLLSTSDLGCEVLAFDELPSTNEEAMRLGRAGARHGTIVVAERQTAGKGRRGRSWSSPPGVNLHLSAILRPELPAARAPELTLVAAVALCETLREAGVEARIKWPNDVEASGRKLAGILTELHADGDRVGFVVLGLGVNLNVAVADLPEELHGIATSARELRGEPVPRALFCAALLTRLETWLDTHDLSGFEPVLARWRELSSTLGRPVRVSEADRVVEGVAEDVAPDGALLVRTAAGVERVVAGDVVTLRPSGGS